MRRETRGQGLSGNLRGRWKELVMAVQRSVMGDPYFEAPGMTLLALVTVPDSSTTTTMDKSASPAPVAVPIVVTMASSTGATTMDHTMATPLTVLSLIVVSATWTTY